MPDYKTDQVEIDLMGSPWFYLGLKRFCLALCLPQVPEEALAHSLVTNSSVMATSYNAKAVAMARRNAR